MSGLDDLLTGRVLPTVSAVPADVAADLDALLVAGWPPSSGALLLVLAAREHDDGARRGVFRSGVRSLRDQFAVDPGDDLLDALVLADRLLARWAAEVVR